MKFDYNAFCFTDAFLKIYKNLLKTGTCYYLNVGAKGKQGLATI
jgi:hypothetical protein